MFDGGHDGGLRFTGRVRTGFSRKGFGVVITLPRRLARELPANKRIGESWEIVDRPEAQSIVREGRWPADRFTISGLTFAKSYLARCPMPRVFRC